MRTAQPSVNFFTRVSVETDKRLRRLQKRTGYPNPRLVDEALTALERALEQRQPGTKTESTAA
jgi:hypothetical protein